jgi:hypothetical protein
MIIAGGREQVEIDAARYFRSAAPHSVEVWIVHGAAHTKGYDTRPRQWEARVVGFLDRSLA